MNQAVVLGDIVATAASALRSAYCGASICSYGSDDDGMSALWPSSRNHLKKLESRREERKG